MSQFESDADRTIISPAATDATQVVSQPQANVTQMAVTLECPVCNTVNPSTETYCTDCGFLLGSTPVDTETPEVLQPSAKLIAPDGREFFVRVGVNTVGRVDSDILLADQTVSRRHAVIEFRDDAWWLTDLGSTNGTFVDNTQLQANQPFQLISGAHIKFGTSPLSFEALEVVPAPEGSSEVTTAVETEPVRDEGLEAVSPEEAVEAEKVEIELPDASEGFGVEALEAETPPVQPEIVEPETPALVGKLVDITDPTANYPVVSGVNTIGRVPANNIQITGDPYVSSHHADINCSEDACTITDVGSTNGTLLNGISIPKQEPQELKNGDEISIGQRRYRFEA